jgi:hypothetical protein
VTRSEVIELYDLIGPLWAMIAYLTSEQRTSILLALLTQEICRLPPGERSSELARIIDTMPRVLRSTEEGMRLTLAANARDGEGA